jgi:uncharacterized damage-inducible protein DinB
MLDFLRDLMAHGAWADAVFLQTWGKSPARAHEEMRQRAGHMVGVQAAFLMMLNGEKPSGPPPGPPLDYDALHTRFKKTHDRFQAWLQSHDPKDLDRTICVPWFQDPPCEIAAWQAIVQVAMHSQHHRGQCMTRLKDFGGEPKNVDWIIWLWKGKPSAIW